MEFRSYSLQQVAYTIVDNIESLTIKTEKFSESKISKLRLEKKKTLVRSVLSKTKSLAMLNFNHDSKIRFNPKLKEETIVEINVYSVGLKGDMFII